MGPFRSLFESRIRGAGERSSDTIDEMNGLARKKEREAGNWGGGAPIVYCMVLLYSPDQWLIVFIAWTRYVSKGTEFCEPAG